MRVQVPDFPNLPARLSRLSELIYNLWWSWNGDARELLKRVNPLVWERTGHNAVSILRETTPEQFNACAENPGFLELYDSVLRRFDAYMNSGDKWFQKNRADAKGFQVAYLCAEFAIHGSLPIYSGGLGVLAGDTCKEASDLGLPFAAIGSLYPEGYFRQVIDSDGRQQAVYDRFRVQDAPLLQVFDRGIVIYHPALRYNGEFTV